MTRAEILAALDRLAAEVAALRRAVAAAPEDEAEHEAVALDLKVAELARACRERGLPVSGDGHVSEAAAAALLGLSPFTLRNRRLTDRPIPCRRFGRRIEYALTDLAAHLRCRAEIDDDL